MAAISDINRYIDYIRDGHPELATTVLLRHYPLVGSCGRVCVRPCEKACLRNQIDTAVGIKELKRHAADEAGAAIEDFFPKEERPVSPVSTSGRDRGAGPAGINCATICFAAATASTSSSRKPTQAGWPASAFPPIASPTSFSKPKRT